MQSNTPLAPNEDPIALMLAQTIGAEVLVSTAPIDHSATEPEDPADSIRLRTLMSNCVDAMATLQARMGHLERLTIKSAEAAETNRKDLQTLQTRAEAGDRRIDDVHMRLAAVETAQTENLESLAADLIGSHGQIDVMRSQAQENEAVVGDLRSRLQDAEATVRHQRARLACMHAKLATSLDASRLHLLSRSVWALTDASEQADGVIDVRTIGHEIVEHGPALIETAA